MLNIRRALVLGSNSFSGSHLVARLLLDGIPVVGMSRSAEPELPFAPYRQLGSDSAALFRFVRCDLNTQSDRVEQVVSEFRPTHVFNFAAQVEFPPLSRQPGFGCQAATAGAVGRVLS